LEHLPADKKLQYFVRLLLALAGRFDTVRKGEKTK
jgi:hypothetical protein